MANTLETLAAALKLLNDSGVECDVFGGWAEEVLGLREPWQHGDIDLVYQGADFAQVDKAIRHQHETFSEVAGKRFRHKRAFIFRETLCEIILIQDSDITPTTYYWGDVPFRWCQPLLHPATVNLLGRTVTAVSPENLRRRRSLWRETQPHRWRDPASLEI